MPWSDKDALTPQALNSRSGLVFNVKDPAFGAASDGSTDDTAAIQAALSASDSTAAIYIPKGIYSISSALTIGDNTVVFGDGYESVLKFADNTNPQSGLRNADHSGGNANISIRNIRIDGNSSNNSNAENIQLGGIDLRACTDSEVVGCWVENLQGKSTSGPSIGIRVSSLCSRVLIANNKVQNVGTSTTTKADGIFVKAVDARIVGNEVVAATDTSIVAELCSNTVVANNVVDGNNLALFGIAVSDGARDVSVTGNTIRNCQPNSVGGQIYVTNAGLSDSPQRVSIIGNTIFGDISDTNGRGITIEGDVTSGNTNITDIVIADNIISGNPLDGILVRLAERVIIRGNIISKNGNNGIRCRGVLHSIIDGNILESNGTKSANVFFGIALDAETSGLSRECDWINVSNNMAYDVGAASGDRAQRNGLGLDDSSGATDGEGSILVTNNNFVLNRRGEGIEDVSGNAVERQYANTLDGSNLDFAFHRVMPTVPGRTLGESGREWDISADKLVVSHQTMQLDTNFTPASGTASGVTGAIAWGTASDTSFLYVCVSTDSWMRTSLTPF